MIVGPSGTEVEPDEMIGRWERGADPPWRGVSAVWRSNEPWPGAGWAVDGIVTAPIDKAALLAGGYDFPGHTEMLAALTGARVAMMLAVRSPARRAGHHARAAQRVPRG